MKDNDNNTPTTSRSQVSRRQLLGTAAAVAAFTIVPRHVLGGNRDTPPSENLNIAGVGVANRGGEVLQEFADHHIVALCDVDWAYAVKTFERYPQATKYKDYRVMFEKEKNIDAVVVGTPDHQHAPVSMTAMKYGKHVYCEKPLSRTIHEARASAGEAHEGIRPPPQGASAFDRPLQGVRRGLQKRYPD